MPSERRAERYSRATSWPATESSPASGRAGPPSAEMGVVLPAPWGRRRPKNSPASTASETPASAATAPKRFQTSRASTAIVKGSRCGGLDQVRNAVELGQRQQVGGKVLEHERLAALCRQTPPFEQQRHRGRVHARDPGEVDREALGKVRARRIFRALHEHRGKGLEGELAFETQDLPGRCGAHFLGALSDERLRSCSVLMRPSMPPFWIWSLKVPRYVVTSDAPTITTS